MAENFDTGSCVQKNGIESSGTAGGGAVLPVAKSVADCAALLRKCGARAAVLELVQLQGFWLSVMADRSVSVAQRLQASKYYADSIGGFASAGGNGAGVARVRWGSVVPVDVEISEEKEVEK